MKLEKRYSQNHQYMVSYTFTDSDDNNPMGRYLDPFDPSTGLGTVQRRAPPRRRGERIGPAAVGHQRRGAVDAIASQLPWSATAGRDLNGDGFTTDLVPGTTRNSGAVSSTSTR